MRLLPTWLRELRQRANLSRVGLSRPAAPRPEALEDRCVPSASPYYSIDGSGNNLFHPNWGSVGQDLLRTAPAQYGDGVSSLAGASRPSARAISDLIVTDTTDGNLPNNRLMSDWVYAWGQFIDHDIDLTSDGTGSQLQAANVVVPTNPTDPFSTAYNPPGPGLIFFNRSEYDPATGTSTRNPRQQPNDITAFIDGSMIYGSDPTVADALRAKDPAHPGRLKFSTGSDGSMMLPLNNHTYFPGISLDPNDPNAAFSIANGSGIVPDDQLFMGGDVRANENIELTSVHTLFLREHNRLADLIHANNPSMSDDAVYQAARAIAIAEIQSITFNEFLPALLGTSVIPDYTGYKPWVNPGIANEFSTAAFRLGHSLLAPDVQFLNPDGSTKAPPVSLADSFFNPPVLEANGADPILKYLATDNAQEVDNKIVPELQNFLFGPPGAGGFDLASLNIQRGRDHGLADYNTVRAYYGLPRVASFSDITSNPTLAAQLQSLYGSVNNIDLWVGGLAEDHMAGGSVGPLFTRIVANQFQRLRDGDRLWFENLYSGNALGVLEHTTLEQIINRNTVNHDLQPNVFFFRMVIRGTVFNDANHNGVRDTGETDVAGRVIQLLDPSGTLIAQTTTAADGTYRFNNLTSSLNPAVAYQVVEVLPSGVVQTTTNPAPITFTRGETFFDVNFGNYFGGGWSGSPSGNGNGWSLESGEGTGPLAGWAGVSIVLSDLLN